LLVFERDDEIVGLRVRAAVAAALGFAAMVR
jgi:hypothetical protein